MPSSAKPENAGEGQTASAVTNPFENLFAEPTSSSQSMRARTGSDEFEAMPAGAAPAAWQDFLPRLTREEARLSEAIASLPPRLKPDARNALAEVLALYTHHTPRDIAFASLDLKETQAPSDESVSPTGEALAPRVFVVLRVEPTGARIAAEMEAAFAASVVNLVLGGEGSAPDSLRPLSRAELAVIEFLWLGVLREMNELTGAPLWRVDALTSEIPAWLGGRAEPGASRAGETSDASTSSASLPTRFLVLSLRLRIGRLSGLVRFSFTPEALKALDEARNPLLSKCSSGRSRLSLWSQLVAEVPLGLSVGETELTGAELSQLEAGDVVLVSAPHAQWSAGRLEGRVLLFAGDARNLQIKGRVQASESSPEEQSEDEAPATQSLTIEVEALSVFDAPAAGGHLRMNEEQTDEFEDGNGLTLERLAVTLRVELAARNMTLEELASLRPGQLLDLGCSPTDPVNLVAGDRRVASGELIYFEGHLGVRLTEVNQVLT
ncbi:MAG TPA: type III secretion system cytoplasmic ring protein SctQ [Pyrinomonadaceae bacterium]|jgi:type III secretion system YscQ/HrcQ family protein